MAAGKPGQSADIGGEPLPPAWRHALDVFVVHLRDERALAEPTVRAYRTDLERLAGFCAGFGIDDPDEVEPLVLRRWLAQLAERGQARSTIRRKSSSCRGFFRLLARRGLIDSDPAAFLGSPRQERRLPRVLRPGQVAALLEHVEGADPRALRDRALLELLYGTGARLAEVVGLDVHGVGDEGLRAARQARSHEAGAARRACGPRASPLAGAGSPFARTARRGRPVRGCRRTPTLDQGGTSGGRRRRAGGRARPRHAPHPAPLVRYPSAGGRGGPAVSSGATGDTLPCRPHNSTLTSLAATFGVRTITLIRGRDPGRAVGGGIRATGGRPPRRRDR